jgi:hypothetical protein
LGQTIRSEWPPQVMSTLQWHHHTQTSWGTKNKIQQLNSTVTLNLKPNA